MDVALDIEELDGCKRRMRAEIPASVVTDRVASASRSLAGSVKLPGFRKGKVPLDVIRQRFAREIRDQVGEDLVSEYARRGLDQHGLVPLGAPVLDKLELEIDGSAPMHFEATFEVRPPIELGEYRELSTELKPSPVGDEDIDAVLENLREQHARLRPLEGRGAAQGDVVQMDLWSRVDGADKQAPPRTDISVLVGGEGTPEAMSVALQGCQEGQTVEFDDVAGPAPADSDADATPPTVHYRAVIKALFERDVPDLDDEFAKDLGKFDTIQALRDDIRASLERRAEAEARDAAKTSIMEQLVDAHDFPAPESLVEEELDERMQSALRAVVSSGRDPRTLDVDWRAEREKLRQPAERAVRGRMLLETIAQREGIQASDSEVQQRLRDEAKRQGVRVEEVKARVEQGGGLQVVRSHLVTRKTLDFLLKVANITTLE